MKKIWTANLILAMALLLVMSGSAFGAITNVVKSSSDSNTLTVDSGLGTNNVAVSEEYNETTLVPYPSHDGYAITNEFGVFFIKEVTVNSTELVTMNFVVTNNTPYTWSDYHFIFSDDVRLDPSDLGQRFITKTYENNELSFWAPDWIEPGETFAFTLHLNPTDNFTISQVATTTPIPGAFWMLGSGLLGLIGFRKRFTA